MAFTVYKSTDIGAPTLNGLTGSLINVLDGCLVNGYGNKPGAGWTTLYTSATSSGSVYRPGAGNRHFFQVNDTGDGAGSTKEARITGFVSGSITSFVVTSSLTGSYGYFPNTSGSSAGSYIVQRKSNNTSSTAIIWVCTADSRSCYFFAQSNDTASNYTAFGMGDFYSLVPNDTYNSFVCGRMVDNTAVNTAERLDVLSTVSATSDFHVPRGWDQAAINGAGLNMGRTGNIFGSAAATFGANLNNPNPADGGQYFSNIWISDKWTTSPVTLRGRIRGLWHWAHAVTGWQDQDTFAGLGDLAGKTFLFLKTSGNLGCYMIETSNTLETN